MFYIILAILAIGLLIVIHEFGHFVFCKIFGVKVLKFSIGFGPDLFKRKIGDTDFSVAAIPWGGYVKPLDSDLIQQMTEEAESALGTDKKEEAREFVMRNLGVNEFDIKNRSLSSKPTWQRFFVIFAGPLFNVLFGLLFVFLSLIIGFQTYSPLVGGVKEGSPAFYAGIATGDVILKIQGEDVKSFIDIKRLVAFSDGKELSVTVKRDDKIFPVKLTPVKQEDMYVIGIISSNEMTKVSYSVLEALSNSVLRTVELSYMTVVAIKRIFTGELSSKTLGGPITLFRVTKQAVETELSYLLSILFFISVNLAFFNLLPIPLLDGGHILFIILEVIIRKKISTQVREVVTAFGIIILVSLMVFAFFNDIALLFEKH